MMSITSLITVAVMAATLSSQVSAQTQSIGQIVRSLATTPSNFRYQEYAYTLAEGGRGYESVWDDPGYHVLFIPSDRAYRNEDAPVNATRTQFPKVTAPNGILFQMNHPAGVVAPIKTTKEVNYAFFFKDYKNRTAVAYDDFNHGGPMEKESYGCLAGRDGRQLRYWTGVEGPNNMENSCCAVDVIDATNGVIFVTECPVMAPPPWTDVLDVNAMTLFKGYIQKSGFDKILNAQPKGVYGKYTVFAPKDETLFALQSQLNAYTDSQLKAWVANHIVEGHYPYLATYYGASSVRTLLGETINLSGTSYSTSSGARAELDWPWDLTSDAGHFLFLTSGVLTPSEANRNGSPGLSALLGEGVVSTTTTTVPGTTAAPTASVTASIVAPSAAASTTATKTGGAVGAGASALSFMGAVVAALFLF
ncbi:hypothetical protein BC829DRAFT_400527 [Chytridium lagenaria]|nr:hypothetical protein BC829DRAFT_400527 [Chytridium lagenaria]